MRDRALGKIAPLILDLDAFGFVEHTAVAFNLDAAVAGSSRDREPWAVMIRLLESGDRIRSGSS
ncbi:MAG: hypothetical protein HZT40_18575 [Candidatus Thiothrix singaporensis]|uniref:Uncharacterized protein n=1 Tax=Candidatus Thiothrix singaporensis TaxID=2799669 RepID=A0A7L6AVV6_9GAMM|nr:MAG: hypothetical protein HZT40_18575 [Candidatus Thiothrix singaporensis]